MAHSGGTGVLAIALYLVFSSIWYLMVRRYPDRCSWRLNISLAADLGVTTFFMAHNGQHGAWAYPVFLWVIIGNGIRFGRPLMIRGIGLGALGFTYILYGSEYWRANLETGAGLLTGVVILPIFYLGVLQRLQAMHELRLELAESRLADKAKDQFLAAMSHELRTPMNGVLGMAETLNTTELDENQKEHMQVITRSVESLLHVINDILDYSKITAGNMNLEAIPLDLKEVLDDVVQLLNNTARSKGLDLDFTFPEDGPRYFLGDPTRIRQIIFNLLGNAVKFTTEGSVHLQCVVDHVASPAAVTFVVSDTGIGIPANRLESIFDHFEQADNSTTRKFGGTGLGLAISRQMAEMMNGGIEVTSIEGHGSTFRATVELPLGPKPVQEEPVVEQELPEFGYSALVVEDNKFNQVVVKNILKRIGVTATIAENGAEALEVLENDNFDVVFMDVRMPIMNGYDATAAIRQRTDLKAQIPIFALTGEGTKTDVEKCHEVGMDLHLAKPIRLEKIVNALNRVEEISQRKAAVPQLV